MINLKCLSCGATLEISADMTSFACGYCSSQQMVERKGGTVALKPITDAIGRIQAGTDKTAAELALKRLAKELEGINQQRSHRKTIGYSQLDQTSKSVAWFCVAGLVTGIIFSPNINASNYKIIVVLVGLGAGLAIGIHRKLTKDKIIKEKPRVDLKAIDSKISTLKRKIEMNRKIADS